MADKQKLKNKDAVEYEIKQSGEDNIDIYPLGKKDQTDENMEKQDRILEEIVKGGQKKGNDSNPLPNKEITDLIQKIKLLSSEDTAKIKSLPDLLSILKLDLNDLIDKQIDFLYEMFNLNGASTKEFNEFGLRADIDKEVLQYCSKAEFNPDTDEYIPPIFENLTCNRVFKDYEREELPEEYRDVYDLLDKDDDDYDEINDDEGLPDNFVILANNGELPIQPKDDFGLMIDKIIHNQSERNENVNQKDRKNENVNENKSKTISNINKKTELTNVINNKRLENNDNNLDIEYLKTKKEYDERDCPTQENMNYNDKQTKERLAEALAEIESMNVGIKFPNKLNKNENNNENDYDYEEYEDEEEGEYLEEDEDYDDYNNKYKDFDYNEKNQLRIQDGVDLLPKDQIRKIIEMNEKIKENITNQDNDNDNSNQYDSLTWEQLNNIILNKESISQTLRLLNERGDKKEDEVNIPELPEPRQYYSIINKLENDETFISNQPKKIGVKSVKLSKLEKNNQTKAKISQSKEKDGKEEKEEERITKKNYDLTKIDEMDKKERKKFVKLINKERRENKKDLKKTFNSEKIKVRNVVSNANKVLRNGLSVKEI